MQTDARVLANTRSSCVPGSRCRLTRKISQAARSAFPTARPLARVGAPFAVALGRLNGGQPLVTPAALKPLSGNYRISHERATRDLGYRPRPLKETLVDTWNWFENNGFSPPLSGGSGHEVA